MKNVAQSHKELLHSSAECLSVVQLTTVWIQSQDSYQPRYQQQQQDAAVALAIQHQVTKLASH